MTKERIDELARLNQEAADRHMNIFDYFVKLLGEDPSDDTLRDLPVDSNCGDDCKKAIDAAATLLERAAMAGTVSFQDCKAIRRATDEIIVTFWRG